jgi:hypothetical protein
MNILEAFLKAGMDDKIQNYPERHSEAGNLPGLSKGFGLNPEQRQVESWMAYKLSLDWNQAIADYQKLAKIIFSHDNVVNIDVARLLAGSEVYDTRKQKLVNLRATNGPAAQLTIEYFWDQLLKRPAIPSKDQVLVLMGVGGSGKTAAVQLSLQHGNKYHAIFERVLSRQNELKDNIDRILDAGKRIDLRLVLRKPEDIFLTRIQDGIETGKTEWLDQVALRYAHCLRAFEAVAEFYRLNPDPRVRIRVMTNFGPSLDSMQVVGASKLPRIKKDILGLDPAMGSTAMNLSLQDRAYKALEEYETSHPSGTKGHLIEPFRSAIVGNRARGIEQSNTPDEQTIYAGMIEKQVAKIGNPTVPGNSGSWQKNQRTHAPS